MNPLHSSALAPAVAFAAALAALPPMPAAAQSNLSIYGAIDSGVLSISNTSSGTGYLPKAANPNGHTLKQKDGGIGGSNFGFRGTEDLGGGLKAQIHLQGNVSTESGAVGGPNSSSTTSFFNQFATVGLASAWGAVKLGRQVSPLYYTMAATDARGGRYFGSSLTGLVGLNSASGAFIGNNSNPAFGTIYNDNAVAYTSPVWNHLTFNALYAFGETGHGAKANSQQVATVVYDANGLKLSGLVYNGYGNNLPAATAAYTVATGSAAAGVAAAGKAGFSPTANTNRLYSAGALYQWDGYTVSASYFAARNPAKAILPGGSYSLDMWTLGAGWKISPTVAMSAGYYHIKDNTNAGHRSSQLVLGLDYLLSRRSTLYVEGAYTSNRGSNMNLSPVYATAVAADRNVTAVMLGLRHTF
ncbi:porin [Comamonas humi]